MIESEVIQATAERIMDFADRLASTGKPTGICEFAIGACWSIGMVVSSGNVFNQSGALIDVTMSGPDDRDSNRTIRVRLVGEAVLVEVELDGD